MLVAILITCAQSFSNENHEVNCGRAIRARPAARAKRNGRNAVVILLNYQVRSY